MDEPYKYLEIDKDVFAPLTVFGFTGAEKVVWYTLIIIIITNIIATFAPRFIKK